MPLASPWSPASRLLETPSGAAERAPGGPEATSSWVVAASGVLHAPSGGSPACRRAHCAYGAAVSSLAMRTRL